MPKLPRTSGAEAIRVLGKLGFHQARERGGHVFFVTRMDAVVSFRFIGSGRLALWLACFARRKSASRNSSMLRRNEWVPTLRLQASVYTRNAQSLICTTADLFE